MSRASDMTMARFATLKLEHQKLAAALDLTMERFDALKDENTKLAAALGMESAARTTLMDDTQGLMLVLTSDAMVPLPMVVRASIRGFLNLHPEVAPR